MIQYQRISDFDIVNGLDWEPYFNLFVKLSPFHLAQRTDGLEPFGWDSHQGSVNTNIFIKEAEFHTNCVSSYDPLSQNDFFDFGTIFANCTFYAHVNSPTSGQVDIRQILHAATGEKLPEDARIDVVGIKLKNNMTFYYKLV